MVQISEKISFKGHDGDMLAARLERPVSKPRAYALFAHCFSCSKDILAATRVSRHLTRHGIAVLRFDFTGLGASEGEFENTSFTSNVQDVIAAANWMREEFGQIDLIVGHSLGGAAAIVAASQIDDVRAVATIGAPAHADHVLHQISHQLDRIEDVGQADVTLAGRSFTIKRQFVDDVREAKVLEATRALKRPLLILHSPMDETVGIDNATDLFSAAYHPKSFISLDRADHLLTNPDDSEFAADAIAAWAMRYLAGNEPDQPDATGDHNLVTVQETGEGEYANFVSTSSHILRTDEPESLGGLNTGPGPFEYLSAALGACTSITLRMYLNRKGWSVDNIKVNVTHYKAEFTDENGRNPDVFTLELHVEGKLSSEQRDKLIEIANKCPVHKTLNHASIIETRLK